LLCQKVDDTLPQRISQQGKLLLRCRQGGGVIFVEVDAVSSQDKKYARSWKRYLGGRRLSLTAHLVEPFKQVRFGLYVIGVFFGFLAVLVGVLVWAFREQYLQVMDWFSIAQDAAPDLMLNDVSQKAAWIVSVVLVAFIVTMLNVIIRRTHRMYGPMISINRFIEELKRGNYSARLKTRENDDFQDLVARLNGLAEALHARHGVLGSSEIAAKEQDEEVEGPDVVSVQKPGDKV
jgi:methyl-accepting chemotaxis protein